MPFTPEERERILAFALAIETADSVTMMSNNESLEISREALEHVVRALRLYGCKEGWI